MKTSFVTIQVPLKDSTVSLCLSIEDELTRYGTPLRWAITNLDRVAQTAHVEAIVTCGDLELTSSNFAHQQ